MDQEKAIPDTAARYSAIEIVRNTNWIALSLTRCIFAALALFIVAYRSEEQVSGYLATYTRIGVGSYFLYSLAYFFFSKDTLQNACHHICYWIDALLLAYVMAVMQIHDSVFFMSLLFPVIVASRLADSRAGMFVTITATLLYLGTAFAVINPVDLSPIDLTSRAICLLLLGLVFVYWAANEEIANKKLNLLMEINNGGNARLGMERTMLQNLGCLVRVFEAKAAILVVNDAEKDESWKMYVSHRCEAPRVSEITKETYQHLMQLPPGMSMAYSARGYFGRRYLSYLNDNHHEKFRNRNGIRTGCEALLNILETNSFATTPFSQRNGKKGRIYIISTSYLFSAPDIHFLVQVSRALSIMQENMYLTEQMISKATEYERLQISRDMHDTTIQPYIGLKLALDALLRQAQGTKLEGRIAELITMVSITISDLRTYSAQLREKTSMPGENLIAAILKQAEIYAKFYGIKVELKTKVDAPINGQVAAELLQIISEGLSNVLRHTNAKRVDVNLNSDACLVVLEIRNRTDNNLEGDALAFSPKTITERAHSLGGKVTVRQDDKQFTSVVLQIPNYMHLET